MKLSSLWDIKINKLILVSDTAVDGNVRKINEKVLSQRRRHLNDIVVCFSGLSYFKRHNRFKRLDCMLTYVVILLWLCKLLIYFFLLIWVFNENIKFVTASIDQYYAKVWQRQLLKYSLKRKILILKKKYFTVLKIN